MIPGAPANAADMVLGMGTRSSRAILMSLVLSVLALAQEPPPPAPPAKPAPEPSLLKLACSDTVLQTMEQAGAEYHKVKPAVRVEVGGGGSGAALAALANGAARIAVTTRQANEQEFATIRGKGFEPVQQVIGYQQYVVVVHATNPIESLTMAQLAELWGETSTITKWSQLGVPTGAWSTAPVRLVGPQDNSQAHEMFRALVMGRAKTRADIVATAGEKDRVEEIAKEPTSIGYCRAEFAVGDAVRIVPLVRKAGDKPMSPTMADGYPLQRAIYVYFRDEPDGHAKAFAKWLQTAAAVRTMK